MIHADDLVLVRDDDHVIEPPDLFAGRLPAEYAADAGDHFKRTSVGTAATAKAT